MSGGRWEPAEPGICSAPDVGGDIQAGDAWDVRFWRADRPQAVVTVWIYPVRYDAAPGYRVQVQTELTICTDREHPGDTEKWADAFYYDDPEVHDDPAAAGRAARRLAGEYAAGQVHVTGWDGLHLAVPAADASRNREC